MRHKSPLLLALAAVAAAAAYLAFLAGDKGQDWEQRRARFQEAALRAEPLIAAINAHTSSTGKPPQSLAEITPEFASGIPATGMQNCARYEYRSLAHKAGSIVWYDLGSRQGQPYPGQSRFEAGDPGHAVLVFTLDPDGRIASALLDRIPDGREPEDFDARLWSAGKNRIAMALSLADTYQLRGMPREVFEQLLGPPEGERILHGPLWELRINCPTGLLNHDTFVYWPTEDYPEHLYGGHTESVGRWVYVHSL